MIAVENTQKKNPHIPVKLETIEYGRARMHMIEKITGTKPAYLVEAIEAMQHEYEKHLEHRQIIPCNCNFNLKNKKEKLDFLIHEIVHSNFWNSYNENSLVPSNSFTTRESIFNDLITDTLFSTLKKYKEEIKILKEKKRMAEEKKRMAVISQALPIMIDNTEIISQRIEKFKKITGLTNFEVQAVMQEALKLQYFNLIAWLYSNHSLTKKEVRAVLNTKSAAMAEITEIKNVLEYLNEMENLIKDS